MEKILKFFVWGFILILLLLGVKSIIFPIQNKIVKEAYKEKVIEKDIVKSVAIAFAKEYLTYNMIVNDGKYKTKVAQYFPTFADNEIKSGWQRAESTDLWDFQIISEDKAFVTVHSKIIKGDEKNYVGTSDDYWLKVAVKFEKGLYYVSDYPIFTQPNLAKINEITPEKIDLKVSNTNINEEVKSYLNNFFAIYDKGNSEQLQYMFKEKNKTITGYNGKWKFENIDKIDTYVDGKGYFAKVTIVVSSTGSKYKQTFNVKLEKTDKWYIVDIL